MKKNKSHQTKDMSPKGFYLRGFRVGSSAFNGCFGGINHSIIRNTSHSMYESAEILHNRKREDDNDLPAWDNLHKIVSVRNPFDHHVATFFKRSRHKIRRVKGYRELFHSTGSVVSKEYRYQTPKVQKRIAECYMKHVDNQHTYYKNEIESVILNGGLDRKMGQRAFVRCYLNWPIYTLNNEIMASLCIKGDAPGLKDDLLKMLKLLDLEDDHVALCCVDRYLKRSKARGYDGKNKRSGGWRNYRDFYNPETERKVSEIRAMEINAHKYEL